MEMIKVRQTFEGTPLGDVKARINEEVSSKSLSFSNGSRIAIAVGSRGISRLPEMVAGVAEAVSRLGGKPFIVPAMGSHGDATADGQAALLKSLGVDEESVGVPVISSMEVVELGTGPDGTAVFMDRHAHEADGIILINRIKPHTDFHGPHESGLVKMATIGLGKHRQALEIHRYGLDGLKNRMVKAAERVLATGKVILGIGIVENANDQPMIIEALFPGEIPEREPDLLQIARENMPSLPVKTIDVLIVDQIGKNISGTGMDPNIIGRYMIRGMDDPPFPDIKNIVITDLTDESHGNANGMGFGDVITRRLYRKINFSATYENIITAAFLERGKVPVVAETDKRAVEIALRAAGSIDRGQERLVRIPNTLHLEELYLSPVLYESVKDRVESLGPVDNIFTSSGDLIPF